MITTYRNSCCNYPNGGRTWKLLIAADHTTNPSNRRGSRRANARQRPMIGHSQVARKRRSGKLLSVKSTVCQVDVTRPTLSCDLRRVARSQSAVCRLFAQVDFRRKMRPIAFVDPGAFFVPKPGQISQNKTSGRPLLSVSFAQGLSPKSGDSTFPKWRKDGARPWPPHLLLRQGILVAPLATLRHAHMDQGLCRVR